MKQQLIKRCSGFAVHRNYFALLYCAVVSLLLSFSVSAADVLHVYRIDDNQQGVHIGQLEYTFNPGTELPMTLKVTRFSDTAILSKMPEGLPAYPFLVRRTVNADHHQKTISGSLPYGYYGIIELLNIEFSPKEATAEYTLSPPMDNGEYYSTTTFEAKCKGTELLDEPSFDISQIEYQFIRKLLELASIESDDALKSHHLTVPLGNIIFGLCPQQKQLEGQFEGMALQTDSHSEYHHLAIMRYRQQASNNKTMTNIGFQVVTSSGSTKTKLLFVFDAHLSKIKGLSKTTTPVTKPRLSHTKSMPGNLQSNGDKPIPSPRRHRHKYYSEGDQEPEDKNEEYMAMSPVGVPKYQSTQMAVLPAQYEIPFNLTAETTYSTLSSDTADYVEIDDPSHDEALKHKEASMRKIKEATQREIVMKKHEDAREKIHIHYLNNHGKTIKTEPMRDALQNCMANKVEAEEFADMCVRLYSLQGEGAFAFNQGDCLFVVKAGGNPYECYIEKHSN